MGYKVDKRLIMIYFDVNPKSWGKTIRVHFIMVQPLFLMGIDVF